MRELTEKEKEQRRILDERFVGRKYPPINPMDIGLPTCDEAVCEDERHDLV